MPHERPEIPNRLLEAVNLRPISRPNVNFRRTAWALNNDHVTFGKNKNIHGPRDYDGTNQPRDLQQPTHILNAENRAGIDVPLPVSSSTTSINWWPYPPWGQSTVSPTPPGTLTPSLSSSVAVVLASPPAFTTSPLAATPSLNLSATPSVTVFSVAAPAPATSLPSRPEVHVTTHPSFNPVYLIPVFVAVGLLLGALSGLLGYRWYLRRQARKGGNGNGTWRTTTLIPGPPYVAMHDPGHSTEGVQEASLTTIGSPSKYTRHGARASWLPSITRTGLRRASMRSTVPPSHEGTTSASASSHLRPLSHSPTRARSRESAIPLDSLSDEENTHHGSTRITPIRRSILGRLQRPDRSARSVSRDPSQRTTRTYLSTASAYSGTHPGESRSPSAVPSSTPPSHDTNTEWVPGSGFRIVVEEAISGPPPSTTDQPSASSLPGRTSAWDSGEALLQAVDTHPGERWLAWTRSWASSPPLPNKDRFTAVPSRRSTQEKKNVEVLLRSPPQVTSSPLQSTLTFSPQPEWPSQPANNGSKSKQYLEAPVRTRPALQAARGNSDASSIVQGDGHGTPAMRYAARHGALSRVEEILAYSYSSRDLAPNSPNAFGAAPASLGDIAWAAGIEQRLASATFDR